MVIFVLFNILCYFNVCVFIYMYFGNLNVLLSYNGMYLLEIVLINENNFKSGCWIDVNVDNVKKIVIKFYYYWYGGIYI